MGTGQCCRRPKLGSGLSVQPQDHSPAVITACLGPLLCKVQVMSCPGGCVGGGGQPKTTDPLAVAKRARAIYSIDEAATIRKSHENPSVQKLYQVRQGWRGMWWRQDALGLCIYVQCRLERLVPLHRVLVW